MEEKLTVRVSKELADKAREKSKKEDITVSQFVRRALRKWIEDDPPNEKLSGP